MRRSAALLSLLLVLNAARPVPAHASAAPLTVGIWNDPASCAAFAMWAVMGLAQLMQLGDEVADHLKEDVRRARDPHSAPRRIVPVRLPRPEPLVDPLSIRSVS